MEALDGNAIAGHLYEVFGREMTTARGSCKSCGDNHMVGELRVYLRAPGAVVRCPRCAGVLMVLVTVRGEARIDTRGIDGMDPPPAGR